ncbi:MAG: pilin [bacterium]|nr:pilin [bacterium]
MTTVFLKLFSATAHAQNAEYTLNYKFPGQEQVISNPSQYVNTLFQFGLGIVGLVALGFVVYGGIRYILSAGNPSQLSDARSQMLSAIIGIGLLSSAYLILNEINPELLNLSALETNPLLKELKPGVAFNYAFLKGEWDKAGAGLAGIQAHMDDIKKRDTAAYKAALSQMSDAQRLTYFKGLDPIAQKNFVVTLSALGIPFGGLVTQLNTNETTGTYESMQGSSEQTAFLHKLTPTQTTALYYNYDAQHQKYLLAQMSDAQYTPLYNNFLAEDKAAAAEGKESNHARDFLQQVSGYYDNDLRTHIVVEIYKNTADGDKPKFLTALRAIDSNLASNISVALSDDE